MIAYPGYYWPPGVSREGGVDALRSVFEGLGYEVCDSDSLEEGYQKVALYADATGSWTHAAKQEANGEWSSKLGSREDIRHNTPHCFGGSIYGAVVYILRKKVPATTAT